MKLRIFQSIFILVRIHGMDTMTLTTPQLHRLGAYYFRFLRRVVGIKEGYYSRVSNFKLCGLGESGFPDKPSEYLWRSQYKFMREVYLASGQDPYHTVFFCSAYRDGILAQGRRRGMHFPYWLEVMSKRYFPDLSNTNHTALGPHFKYAVGVRVHGHSRNYGALMSHVSYSLNSLKGVIWGNI